MKSILKPYLLIFFFLIFTTYKIQDNKKSISFFFPIKKILIENNIVTNLLELKSDFNFLINTSLFALNEEKIIATTSNYDFISSIQLNKKYPNTLKIKIIEKIPVAIQITGKKKFYITAENKKINFVDLAIYNDLPIIFGKYKNFDTFYKDLKKNTFNVEKIKAFYYFDIGRWDIELKNGKVIKLPEKNYIDLMPKINLMLNDNNFSIYKVFDFRIKNQLILK